MVLVSRFLQSVAEVLGVFQRTMRSNPEVILYVTHWAQKFKDKNDYESSVFMRTGNLLNTLLTRTTCSGNTAQQAGESANSYLNVQPLQTVCWAPCGQCGAHLQLRMVLCF